MTKIFKVNSWGTEEEIYLQKTSYSSNGRLAITAVCAGYGEPFTKVTVNVDAPLSGDESTHAFVDTNNNADWGVEKVLQENGFAKPTGKYARNGFCEYPEYEFDLSKF